MAPVGADLTCLQLLEALLWKLSPEEGEQTCGSPKWSMSELDIVTDKLIAALSTTRSLRNSLSSIYRLPPETMARIFSKLQQEPSDPLPSRNAWTGVVPKPSAGHHFQERSMMLVTSVCRYWRETALAHPALWSFLFSATDADYAVNSLKRSGGAPLNVRFTPTGAALPNRAQLDNDGFMDALIAQSHRLRELRIQRPHDSVEASLLSVFRDPALELETLELSLRTLTPDNPVLPTLFAGQTPKLRRLTLQFFTSWPGNVFENLTHLHLHRQSPHGLPTLAGFLDFLQASPNLEELVSVHGGISDDVVPPVPVLSHALVRLDSLRTVSFGCWESTRAVRHILFHLVLPAHAHLYVWADTVLEPEDDLSSLYLAHSGAPRDAGEIKDLSMVMTANYFDGNCREEFVINSAGVVQHHARTQPTAVTPVMVNTAVCAFGGVETLGIGSHFGADLTLPQWKVLFDGLGALKRLVIWQAAADPIISALTLLSSQGDGERGTLICPQLRSVDIYWDKSLTGLCLALFARARARGGAPLQSIWVTNEIEQPELQSELADTLKDVVEQVECDVAGVNDFESAFETTWPPPGYESRLLY